MWREECRFYLIPSSTHLFPPILTAIRILRCKNRAPAVNHFIFCWIALTNLFQHFSDFSLSSVVVSVVISTLTVVEENNKKPEKNEKVAGIMRWLESTFPSVPACNESGENLQRWKKSTVICKSKLRMKTVVISQLLIQARAFSR